jgi:hypothetical protein
MTRSDRFIANGLKGYQPRPSGFTIVATALLLGASQQIAIAKEEPPSAAGTTLDVRVTFEGKPVAGAQVVATDAENHARGVTGSDGTTRLKLPDDRKINGIVALEPKIGIGGRWFGARAVPVAPGAVFEMSLAPASPHTIRVVDGSGRPVRLASIVISGLALGQGNWLQTGHFEGARFHTDARGEALVPWVPRDVKSVGIDVVDDRWKIEGIDRSQAASRVETVTVRKLRPVDGRLSIPDGTSPEGLLITGTGNASRGSSHALSAHVRRDGTFTLYVAADYAYALCLVDDKWASDKWKGVILTSEEATPKELNFVAYPSTPVTVSVTRGPKHEPVADAWINVHNSDEFSWRDAHGEQIVGDFGPQRGLYTDRNGRAHFFVGKGKHELFVATGNWRETKTIKVASDEPVSADFYRPWTDKRTISGRLIFEKRPHKVGPGTIIRAWNPAPPKGTAEAVVSPDGRFTLAIDAAEVDLLAIDPKNLLSASRVVTAAEVTADLELAPMGSVSGIIVDSSGKRLADQGVELVFGGSDFRMWQIVLQSTTSDKEGRFKLDSVPSAIPLRICAGTPAGARGAAFEKRPDEFQVHSSRELTLEPGEVRENVKLVRGKESND